jgi:hypothetical protein
MDITDQIAVFHLSTQGCRALRGLVPRGASFEAFVVDMDELGAWLMIGRKAATGNNATVPVTLLTWEYVSAVAIELSVGSAAAG